MARSYTYSLVIVLLALLIPLGLWMAWRDVTAGWRQAKQDTDLFLRSPGCSASGTVDPSLPPCTDTPFAVTAKTTHTARSAVNISGTRTAYDIALRNAAGQRLVYRDIYDSFWSACSVGETITVKSWRGQIMELNAGTDRYPVDSLSPQVRGNVFGLVLWLMLSLVLAPALLGVLVRRRAPFF